MTHVLFQDDELFIPDMTDEEFLEFCVQNRDHRIERTAEGKVIVMSATGGTTGSRNQRIARQLGNWAEQDGRGEAFESSSGFRLPNTAIRAPDAAWVAHSRLAQLSEEQKDLFAPLCPEFVIELLSPSDRLAEVKLKMTDYMANGCELGWLIDPDNRRVIVYRTSGTETLAAPDQLVGEGHVAGFVLDMMRIWDPGW